MSRDGLEVTEGWEREVKPFPKPGTPVLCEKGGFGEN